MSVVTLLNPYRWSGAGAGLAEELALLISADLDALGLTVDDPDGFAAWLAARAQPGDSWTVLAATGSKLRLDMSVGAEGRELSVWWGDGTTSVHAPPAFGTGRENISRDYGSTGERGVVVLGDLAEITANISGWHSMRTRSELLSDSMRSLNVGPAVTFSGSVTNLPVNMQRLIASTGVVTGTTAGLPRDLKVLQLTGASTLTGDVANLPPNMETLLLRGNNSSLSGVLTDLPPALTFLDVQGSNTLSGNTSELPRNLNYLRLGGENAVTGDIANVPEGLTVLILTGLNTVSGNVADLPAGLIDLSLYGANTVGGSFADLPPGLEELYLSGDSTVSGPAADLPRTLLIASLSGQTSLGGVAEDLPPGLEELIISSNLHTLGGTAAGFPRSLNRLYMGGLNTVSGDVADLPTGLTGQLLLSGNNTLSGDIADLPSGVTSLSLSGNNTVSGDLADLPAGLTYLYLLKAGGGSITLTTPSLPTGLSSVYLRNLPDNTHVDNFLQAIWDNRDQPKPSSVRSITVDGPDVGNPSNQELIDDLRAYRSPNDDPQYALWSITTNPVLIPASDIEIVGWSKSNLSLSNRTTHTHTHTYTATEQDGNLLLLVLLMGNDGDEDIAGGTPDPKVTFIQASNYVDSGITWASYYVPNQASLDSGSVTFEFVTPSSEVFQIVVIELSPVDTTDPIAESKWHSASGSTSTMGPESYTVPEGGMVVATTIPYGDGGTGQTVSLGTANGFELLFSLPHPGPGGNALAVAYRAVPDGGVISGPVWSLPSADGQAGVGIVFNPGEGGGSTPPEEPEDPVVVTTFTDTEESYIDSGTSIAKALPAFEPGDTLFAAVMHRSALTPPSGWTLVRTQAEGAGATSQSLSVYSRVAQSGDTSFTWTQASANRMGVQYVVARSSTGAVDIESSAGSGSSGAGYDYAHPLPSVTTTVPDSRVLAFSACVYSTSSVKAYHEPSGWERHGTLSESNNRMAIASKAVPTPGSVSGVSMLHDAWDTHSGSEIVVVLAPDEAGTPPPEDFFVALQGGQFAFTGGLDPLAYPSAYNGSAVVAATNSDGSLTGDVLVEVTDPVDVKLWVRMRAVSGDSDAFYAGLNGNILRRFPSVYGQWTWIEITQASLPAGTHTVSVGPGEAGAIIDMVVLCEDTLTPGQIDARLGGAPTEPDPDPGPDPDPEGVLNIVGNPDFDPDNPTWWNGTPITGEALDLYKGLVWWATPANWSAHREKSLATFAQEDDAYSLARNLRDRLQQMLFGFVLTKDLRFLDYMITAMNYTKANLKVGYRNKGADVTWSASPYRCFVSIYDQPSTLRGTDLNALNETQWHSWVFQYAAVLQANAGFTSPAGHNYNTEYNYWRDYFTNEWLPKWQGGGTSSWRSRYEGIRRGSSYDNRRRAAAGEWPPIIAGNDVHSNLSSVWTAWHGASLLPSQAPAALAEVAWMLDNWRAEDTDLIGGTNLLWAQTSTAHGSTARYAMASAYPGYVCADMVMMYLLQVRPSVVNPTLLTQMAKVMNDWFFTGNLSSTATGHTGASMGDIAGEVLRGDMRTVNPQARRAMSSLVIKPYTILAPWSPSGSTLNDTNEFMINLSWTGTKLQQTTSFPYVTKLIALAPKPT